MILLHLLTNFFLFLLSLVGSVFNKRSILITLICIGLMLFNLNFIVFSAYLDDIFGQVFLIRILTVLLVVLFFYLYTYSKVLKFSKLVFIFFLIFALGMKFNFSVSSCESTGGDSSTLSFVLLGTTCICAVLGALILIFYSKKPDNDGDGSVSSDDNSVEAFISPEVVLDSPKLGREDFLTSYWPSDLVYSAEELVAAAFKSVPNLPTLSDRRPLEDALECINFLASGLQKTIALVKQRSLTNPENGDFMRFFEFLGVPELDEERISYLENVITKLASKKEEVEMALSKLDGLPAIVPTELSDASLVIEPIVQNPVILTIYERVSAFLLSGEIIYFLPYILVPGGFFLFLKTNKLLIKTIFSSIIKW